ncbi:MAG: hypothetical protein DA408_19935 [Bacteroidetes bacterium]|nr:MAG: hypothetical protein C7N36_18500 [Bacteroidota bacterium]PTM08749.1 MAG: hypothetical protein DA408_19935 [Bacteroidota bacterium]
MCLRTTCFFLFLFFYCHGAKAQGPISGFMPRPGQLDAAYTYSQEQYDQFFNADGDLQNRRLTARSSNLFLEYGADAKTALVATASYLDHDQLNRGWQDASLWLKYRNERTEQPLGFHNLITAVGLSFPLSNYPTDNPAAIGRRAATFHGRLLWQYEARYGWFVHVQSGLDFQFSPVAQAAIPILVRGGIGTSRYYVDAWVEHYQSLNGNPDNGNLAAGTGSTWTRTGGTCYVPVTPFFGAFVGGAFILGGRNIGKATRWNVGGVFRLGAK